MKRIYSPAECGDAARLPVLLPFVRQTQNSATGRTRGPRILDRHARPDGFAGTDRVERTAPESGDAARNEDRPSATRGLPRSVRPHADRDRPVARTRPGQHRRRPETGALHRTGTEMPRQRDQPGVGRLHELHGIPATAGRCGLPRARAGAGAQTNLGASGRTSQTAGRRCPEIHPHDPHSDQQLAAFSAASSKRSCSTTTTAAT